MHDYIVTPDKKGLPSAHFLAEELHRRGLPTAMDVKGTDSKWETIHFYESGPPKLDSFLQYDPIKGLFKIILPYDSPEEAEEIQAALADILLREYGGHVHNTGTDDRHDLEAFLEKIKASAPPQKTSTAAVSKGNSSQPQETSWIIFSWASVLFGLLVYSLIPRYQHPFTLIVTGLAFVSALGLTFSKYRSK
jgi:hypothetical protein